MPKGKQVLLGLGIMAVVWVLGILLSGEWTTADTLNLSVFPKSFEKPATTIFPFFLIALLITIGYISAIRNWKALFITSLFGTGLPVVSYGVELLLGMLFPEGTILMLPFLILYSPIHLLIAFPLPSGAAAVVAAFAFIALACLGGIASYLIAKRKLNKKTV